MKVMNNTEIKNMFSLEGKVAIVTGGAGSLGEGVATGLALHGADIVVTGRTLETLQETVKKVEAVGKRALAVVCDVTKEEQVKEMVQKTLDAFGKIDILVTVAGIAKRFPAEEFPVDAFEQVMDINVTGTFIPCKIVGNVMKEQGYGKIITVSSVRAFAGHPGGYAAYGTSKGAVSLLTKQLATEWAKYNINVNSVAPTIFWTPLTQEVLEDEKLKKIFLDRIPMGRAALVQDMVGSTVYLASAAADFITGQVIYVDGGCTAG
ncbi:2-dehydro-3-deoxy-D-gluconate 5-dehydrogenase KduD [Clostridium aceticum]|uniref:2-dehydro-3-deoxy-D-gluconate 5-dehydrogenase KduD n=1 Tax=Clostridium aceticum TaxID=84022 RepID=A0A0D8IF73_9CLOT|nr:glucose 1-dehydrogenase [Clostridium aceticum]AKL93943.1 2-dehydro-3-deoxy-D-gluconate 5-dehydrogenase KduD [Clostridium aceticum]KJF28672.1 2-deoxy-D-gluconate 3-dehydrogenase [Clostridium aceticum]